MGVDIERQLTGGLWGAYLARAGDGCEVVLKVLPRHHLCATDKVRQAVGLAERLRESGYPAPRYLLVEEVAGHCVTVQEFVRGTTPEVFRAVDAEQLIELWRLHRGAGKPASGIFDPLAAVRSEDADDCRALKESADRVIWQIYDEARTVIDRTDRSRFRSGDIVHHDFHHRNFLTADGHVTAVIDWEGAVAGDSRIDLCELAWASRPGSPTRSPEADRVTSAAVAAEVETSVAQGIAAGRAIEKLAFGLRSGEPTLSTVLASVTGHLRPQWLDTV